MMRVNSKLSSPTENQKRPLPLTSISKPEVFDCDSADRSPSSDMGFIDTPSGFSSRTEITSQATGEIPMGWTEGGAHLSGVKAARVQLQPSDFNTQ